MYNLAYAMGQPPTQAGTPAGNPILNFIPIILIFVIFYFMLIRPQQKRQSQHAKMIANLKKNDEVVTTGGIYGTIVGIKDDSFILRVDENVKIEVQKNCVGYLKKSHSGE